MRKYGQHFLVNQSVIGQIVDACLCTPSLHWVEIGPGKGALTVPLSAQRQTPFTAVEIDPDMVSFLHKALLPGKVDLVQGNFLDFDLRRLPAGPTLFISNLPYIDAAEILDKVLSCPQFERAVFMFQKEQANRIMAAAGTEFYGPLSILSQARAHAKLLCNVGRGSFNPPPKVQSAVLTFDKLQNPAVPVEKWDYFKKVVLAAFLHRRKTISNALTLAGYGPTERLAAALAHAGIDPIARAEEVALPAYVALAQKLHEPSLS